MLSGCSVPGVPDAIEPISNKLVVLEPMVVQSATVLQPYTLNIQGIYTMFQPQTTATIFYNPNMGWVFYGETMRLSAGLKSIVAFIPNQSVYGSTQLMIENAKDNFQWIRLTTDPSWKVIQWTELPEELKKVFLGLSSQVAWKVFLSQVEGALTALGIAVSKTMFTPAIFIIPTDGKLLLPYSVSEID